MWFMGDLIDATDTDRERLQWLKRQKPGNKKVSARRKLQNIVERLPKDQIK